MDMAGLPVISTGMVCALGDTSARVAAVVKAGICAYQSSQHLNRQNKPIILAQVPNNALPPIPRALALLNQQHPGHAFMLQLANAALLGCLLEGARHLPIPVFMACPELLPNQNARLQAPFLEHLKILSRCNLNLGASRTFFLGRPAGFAALDMAYRYFHSTQADFALIGGVDSFRHFNNQIDALDKQQRLLAEGVADGFALGEAACFVLVAHPNAVKKYRLQPKLYLGKPANTLEAGHRYSQIPCRGDGLSQAFAQALSDAPNIKPQSLYSSMNGESLHAKELGVALIRNARRLGQNLPIHHPAEFFGDLGAAMAPSLFTLVAQNETQPSLIYCSADGAPRGAVCAWHQMP